MRIVQLVAGPLNAYDSKSQRIDQMVLSRTHQVETWSLRENLLDDAAGRRLSPGTWRTGLDHAILHIYGAPPAWAAIPSVPIVVSEPFPAARLPWQKNRIHPTVISPIAETLIPEAVEDKFFVDPPEDGQQKTTFRIGSYGPGRAGVRRMCEQTLARLQRFRDDCQWDLLDRFPAPDEIRSYDAWVDPVCAENDFDGGIAEALVSGCRVIACRNPISVQRLGSGSAGYLIPPGDTNELAHALAGSLFRDEVATAQREAAQAIIAQYKPEVRARALERLYERLHNGRADGL